MRLLPYDAYQSLTRVFAPEEAIVALDVGGNEGHTARRIVSLFPRATVYSFEPSPLIYPALEAVAAEMPSVHPQPFAVGDAEGTIDFHLTSEHWCSSVLAPSELGKRYYGSWLDVQKTITVPIVRLDDWASERGIESVDLLKVDTQGYDLHVLRGAARLLHSGIRAVNCEFQFAAEYDGCSTFSQIDTFLREQDFQMYQLHEVWNKGNEEQTSYGDGLWLRSDVLAALRTRADLPDLSPAGRVQRAIREHAIPRNARVALYGAGRHTRRALPAMKLANVAVAAVIDDDATLQGTQIEGKPVIHSREAKAAGIDAVILSSDAHEPALWRASQPLRSAGIPVIALYGRYES